MRLLQKIQTFGRRGWAGLARAVAASALLLLAWCPPAHAEKRVALVVGNSAYEAITTLPNPTSDARLTADTLKSLGFDVVGGDAQTDLDKPTFDKVLQQFGAALNGADVALFYYAGHGVEAGGTNYLAPIDATPAKPADVATQMISVTAVVNAMDRAHTRINLVLLDACRDNPFRGEGKVGPRGGLAQMQAPSGTLISFATQPRSVALDGDGGHSPYTQALAATLPRPGLGLFKVFNEVGLAVEKSTSGEQVPWLSSSPIDGSFYFVGRPENTNAQTVQPASLNGGEGAAAAAPPDLITDCDRLAAMPSDTHRPQSLAGIDSPKVDAKAATAACKDAMQRYPDVPRFVFEAGRAASVSKDYLGARGLYEKADAEGYPMAANNLGIISEGDEGFPADYAAAFKWYSKAADAGEAVAKANLAYLYERGRGVPKDLARARQLYQEAADAGVVGAQTDLGLYLLAGKGGQKDYARARALFEQAAAAGSAEAMDDLGVMYSEGDGVKRDRKLAKLWYEKAAAAGNSQAKLNLKGM